MSRFMCVAFILCIASEGPLRRRRRTRRPLICATPLCKPLSIEATVRGNALPGMSKPMLEAGGAVRMCAARVGEEAASRI